jgi:mRNA interferase MazF
MTTTTPPSPGYKRCDVVLLLFPNSNLQTAKTRPALIVEADNLDTGLPQVIVCIITSRMFRAGHPSRVTVSLATREGEQSGLLSDSVVMTDNVATVADLAINRVIGSLPMAKIDIALRHTLSL